MTAHGPHVLRLVTALAATAALALAGTASATHGSNLDCGNFSSQAAAQYHLNAHPGDPDSLDGDDDGTACEANECPCYFGPATSAPANYPLPTATPSPTRAPQSTSSSYKARIVRVVDGDTLKVRRRSRKAVTVRLIGIDTPETRRPGVAVECGARQASTFMHRLAFVQHRGRRVGRDVRVRRDPTQNATDRFGRALGYVDRGSDGVDLGRAMLRAGWATVYVYDGKPFRRFAPYSRSRAQAQSTGTGVYKLCEGDFHSEQ